MGFCFTPMGSFLKPKEFFGSGFRLRRFSGSNRFRAAAALNSLDLCDAATLGLDLTTFPPSSSFLLLSSPPTAFPSSAPNFLMIRLRSLSLYVCFGFGGAFGFPFVEDSRYVPPHIWTGMYFRLNGLSLVYLPFNIVLPGDQCP